MHFKLNPITRDSALNNFHNKVYRVFPLRMPPLGEKLSYCEGYVKMPPVLRENTHVGPSSISEELSKSHFENIVLSFSSKMPFLRGHVTW